MSGLQLLRRGWIPWDPLCLGATIAHSDGLSDRSFGVGSNRPDRCYNLISFFSFLFATLPERINTPKVGMDRYCWRRLAHYCSLVLHRNPINRLHLVQKSQCPNCSNLWND
jgi:hypothetical protein